MERLFRWHVPTDEFHLLDQRLGSGQIHLPGTACVLATNNETKYAGFWTFLPSLSCSRPHMLCSMLLVPRVIDSNTKYWLDVTSLGVGDYSHSLQTKSLIALLQA